MYQLPDGIPYIESGSFVVQRIDDQSFRVCRIDGLFSLNEMLPVRSNLLTTTEGSQRPIIGFLDHQQFAASAPPRIVYVAAVWGRKFSSEAEAITAIEKSNLGEPIPKICIELTDLAPHRATLHKGKH